MKRAATEKLFSVARRSSLAIALGWIGYSLVAWLAPGLLCRAGDGAQCAEASNQALGKTPEDGATAFDDAQRGCGLGDATSCNNLGVCYQRGAGVAKSAARAAQHYRQACDAGQGLGCHNLANLLQQSDAPTGEVTAQLDSACALKWAEGCRAAMWRHQGEPALLLKRAEQGCALSDSPSCAMAALVLALTEPGSSRARERIVQVTASCSDDDAASCAMLGLLYARGDGVTRDGARARELLARACRHGAQGACQLAQHPEQLERATSTIGEATGSLSRALSKVRP